MSSKCPSKGLEINNNLTFQKVYSGGQFQSYRKSYFMAKTELSPLRSKTNKLKTNKKTKAKTQAWQELNKYRQN